MIFFRRLKGVITYVEMGVKKKMKRNIQKVRLLRFECFFGLISLDFVELIDSFAFASAHILSFVL